MNDPQEISRTALSTFMRNLSWANVANISSIWNIASSAFRSVVSLLSEWIISYLCWSEWMGGEPGPTELYDQNLSHERRHPNHAEHVILGQTLQDVVNFIVEFFYNGFVSKPWRRFSLHAPSSSWTRWRESSWRMHWRRLWSAARAGRTGARTDLTWCRRSCHLEKAYIG